MFGFLNCNKPVGFSSRDVVNIVQGRPRGRKIKVGHCGTLDPLADGVLVVGVGPAAKLVPYVHELSKGYRGAFRLGAESPTGDLEVEPTIHVDHPVPSRDDLENACRAMIGEISQTPPVYSAIKIDGKRAYDLARKGKDVDVPSRRVRIESVEILAYEYPTVELEIRCGTGTYIRTLGMDIAKAAGTTAVMTSLTRTYVGPFELSAAHAIDALREEELESLLLPAALGVEHLHQVVVNGEDSIRLGNGLCLASGDVVNETAVAVTEDGQLRAVLTRKQQRWCPKKVFPLT